MIPRLPIPVRGEIVPDARNRRVRIGRRMVEIELPEVVRQPLVVSYGMGTDSTALLACMVTHGIRPDLIMFADVGSEKPFTTEYVPYISAQLKALGFPEVTVVCRGKRETIADDSLHEKCERLETMPSLAYGGKSCSLQWKVDEMNQYTNSWMPAVYSWAVGMPVLKLIGYDASPADMRRSTNPGDAQYAYHYPLREAGLQRPQLIEIIAEMGWKQPGKSACFMCPATKRHEIPQLYASNPRLLARSLALEARALLRSAREGKKMTTRGLGRNWAWHSWMAENMPIELMILQSAYDCGTQEWNEFKSIIGEYPSLDSGDLVEPATETCDDFTSDPGTLS
jgi:hypothetical protein